MPTFCLNVLFDSWGMLEQEAALMPSKAASKPASAIGIGEGLGARISEPVAVCPNHDRADREMNFCSFERETSGDLRTS